MTKNINRKIEMIKAMNCIIQNMNNEVAYMIWINLIPDQATEEDFFDCAEDEEIFIDACNLFKELMEDFSKDGFFINNNLY